MRRIFKLLAVLALVAAPAARAQAQDTYRVIVNAANPASQISRTELARIFMKKRTTWESGTAVVVVDQTERSSTRAQFSNQVLGKDVAAMKSYWQQSLFSGRGVPPLEKGSDVQVAQFVAGNDAAIGYVSGSVPLPAGVKVLEVSSR
jgi:ABC-type phosphate transport system substrate-binding protein